MDCRCETIFGLDLISCNATTFRDAVSESDFQPRFFFEFYPVYIQNLFKYRENFKEFSLGIHNGIWIMYLWSHVQLFFLKSPFISTK